MKDPFRRTSLQHATSGGLLRLNTRTHPTVRAISNAMHEDCTGGYASSCNILAACRNTPRSLGSATAWNGLNDTLKLNPVSQLLIHVDIQHLKHIIYNNVIQIMHRLNSTEDPPDILEPISRDCCEASLPRYWNPMCVGSLASFLTVSFDHAFVPNAIVRKLSQAYANSSSLSLASLFQSRIRFHPADFNLRETTMVSFDSNIILPYKTQLCIYAFIAALLVLAISVLFHAWVLWQRRSERTLVHCNCQPVKERKE